MTSWLARIWANQLEPRPPPIEISPPDVTPDASLSDQQLDAELRRAFRLTDQQCALPEPVPANFFSNDVIPIKLINMLLMRLTQFQSLLFTNFAQTPIQSKATQRERSLYRQLVERHQRKLQLKQVAKPIGQKRRSSDQAESQERSPAGAAGSGDGDDDDDDDDDDEANRYELKELRWPERSNTGIALMLTLEFFAIVRGAFIISLVMGLSSRTVRLCVSKDLDTIDRRVYELKPLPFDRLAIVSNETGASVQSRWAPTSPKPDGECLRDLVEFFSQRYGNFLFWNSSDGMQEYGEFVDEFVFLEQSKPLQMFREETFLLMYIILSLVLGCGLTGSIVTYYMPYDVIPLLFIYEPTYCAFHIKMRLMQHLNDARQSYLNYWSIFKLNPDRSLSTRAESPQLLGANLTGGSGGGLASPMRSGARLSSYLTSGQRASFIVYPRNHAPLQSVVKVAPSSRLSHRLVMPADQPLKPSNANSRLATETKTTTTTATTTTNIARSDRLVASKRMRQMLEQVPSLSNELYKDFLPDARTQAFRRILMTASPTLSSWASFWLNISLILTYVVITSFNASTVNLNRDLMLFLERNPDWNLAAVAQLEEDSTGVPLNSTCLSESRPLELVRSSLASYLAEQLGRLNGRAMARQFQDRDQRSQRVAKFLAPTTNPDLHEWTFPEGVSVISAVLIILYLNIFFICIGDLCFWLFDLRVKLNICHLILRYYSDTLYLSQLSAPNNRERHLRSLQQTSSSSTADQSSLIDVILLGFDHIGEHIEISKRVLNVNNEQTPSCLMNLGVYQIFVWAFSSNKSRNLMCYQYAKKIIEADCEAKNGAGSNRSGGSSGSSFEQPNGRPSDTFLMSAYLEFRLFLEQIDVCRQSINVITTYWTIHSINILASSMFTHQQRSRIGFMLGGYFFVNMGFLTASIFQSQCTKIIPSIHSMLALTIGTNKAIRHLAVLWRRSLHDLLGPRSKFFFTVVSVQISYASALQFNFGVTSLYLLTVDRFKNFQWN